jgi:hypothetical protein
MLPVICAFILPNRHRCRQPARRGQTWCRAHEKTAHIKELREIRQAMFDQIAEFDVFYLARFALETLDSAIHRRISRDDQRQIHDAIQNRLCELGEETHGPEPLDAGPHADDDDEQDLGSKSDLDLDPKPIQPANLPSAAPTIRFGPAPDRPFTMADVFGPKAANTPVPPGVDLNLVVRTIHHVQSLPSTTCQTPVKTAQKHP